VRPVSGFRRWWLLAVAILPTAALGVALPVPAARAADLTTGTCAVGQAGWRVPVAQRYVVTSPFGERTDPITHVYRLHAGADLAMLPGPGPVISADSGTVVRAGPYGGLGNEVTLQHADGVQTLYGHMAYIAAGITPGTEVVAGQVLGEEGSTGASTGPHLHFEVHVNGEPVDPVPFMAEHGVPLNGASPSPVLSTNTALPASNSPRKNSLKQGALSVPAPLMNLYVKAAQQYDVPWPLLAGVGMEETAQGRNNNTSSAGAKGVMQFMPGTFARYGVDGNDDGRADILNDADSVYSAANALRAWGAAGGAEGVRRALFSYNHAQWYVNDVLFYAAAYGAGSGGITCTGAPEAAGTAQAAGAVRWARSKVGHGFRFGADGPDAWDSSSFVQAAYAQAGVRIPRTAQGQRNWLASGHGTRVRPGDERPGDLIFEDSYLGPDRIGFVMLVTDPQSQGGVAARNAQLQVARLSYAGAQRSKHIFEIWRVHAPARGSGATD
jgi:hypothetical protein